MLGHTYVDPSIDSAGDLIYAADLQEIATQRLDKGHACQDAAELPGERPRQYRKWLRLRISCDAYAELKAHIVSRNNSFVLQ